MRKKHSIIFICLVMITLNAICLNWAIQQERMKELAVTTASDRKQILSLLLGNMQMHYTYSECQLPDIRLIDKLKNEITLASNVADKRKLVLTFSPQNCYPCIEFSMSCLEKFALSIPKIKERLLIIIGDDNYREYQAISNSLQSDISIYLSKDTTLSTILKKEDVPFIFVMDERLYMDDLFIPIKELPNYSDLYFHKKKTKNLSGEAY